MTVQISKPGHAATRSEQVLLRLTPSEMTDLDTLCERSGQTRQAVLRAALRFMVATETAPPRNCSTCGQPWSRHPFPATHCPPARPVCISRHHRTVVYTNNGTDRCDACQDDNRAEMDAQR